MLGTKLFNVLLGKNKNDEGIIKSPKKKHINKNKNAIKLPSKQKLKLTTVIKNKIKNQPTKDITKHNILDDNEQQQPQERIMTEEEIKKFDEEKEKIEHDIEENKSNYQ
jgi:hypothetical protein